MVSAQLVRGNRTTAKNTRTRNTNHTIPVAGRDWRKTKKHRQKVPHNHLQTATRKSVPIQRDQGGPGRRRAVEKKKNQPNAWSKGNSTQGTKEGTKRVACVGAGKRYDEMRQKTRPSSGQGPNKKRDLQTKRQKLKKTKYRRQRRMSTTGRFKRWR